MGQVRNFKEAIEVINRIENRFNVGSLHYGGIKVWPLIRLHLWSHLHPYTNKCSDSQLEFVKDPVRGEYIIKCRKKKDNITKPPSKKRSNHISMLLRKELKKLNPVDLLFYSRPMGQEEKVEGKVYNKYLDPLIDIANSRYKTLKIQLNSHGNLPLKSYYRSPLFLNMPGLHDRSGGLFPSLTGQGHFFSKKLKELEKLIREELNEIPFDEEFIYTQIQQVLKKKEYFKQILKRLRPKVIFFVYYGHQDCLGLVLAGKNLKIKTVDIQHGYTPKYEGSYTNWYNIPATGYELLPHYYWCWNDEIKKRYEESQYPQCQRQKAIVGGNPWLGKWVQGNLWGGLSPKDALFEKLKNKEKVILINIQPLRQGIPSHVLQTMAKSPANWFWLIRLHPRLREKLNQFHEQLIKDGITNFEIEKSTYYPLYTVLKSCHYQVTTCSTVSYEALNFGVPTIFTQSIGLDLRQDEIDKGYFFYADDKETLFKILNSSQFSAKSLISTDIALAKNALENLMADKSSQLKPIESS